MIYEFAISPSLCTTYQDLRFFLETFGGEQGRLLSDIPRKKWERFARIAIKKSKNGQVEKKRLVAGIEKLIRKAIYCRNSVPLIESETWLDHALAAHKDRPFQAILTNYYDGDEEHVLRNDCEFTEDCQWKVPLDKIVLQSPVLNEVPQLKGLFLSGLVKAEDYIGKIGNSIQLLQNISEYGKIGRIRVLACEQWYNQNRLLPPGVKFELGPEMPWIVSKDMKGAYLTAFL